MPPEPNTADFAQWVKWKFEKCETPDWWEELLAVPGKEDAKRLAREVRASFTLPQCMQELDSREAMLQDPCTAMSLPKEVYAPCQLHLCMQGYLRDPKGKGGGICQGPPVLGRAKQPAC